MHVLERKGRMPRQEGDLRTGLQRRNRGPQRTQTCPEPALGGLCTGQGGWAGRTVPDPEAGGLGPTPGCITNSLGAPAPHPRGQVRSEVQVKVILQFTSPNLERKPASRPGPSALCPLTWDPGKHH